MRRPRVFGLLFVAFAGCSFPDVALVPGDATVPPADSSSGETSDVAVDGDTTADPKDASDADSSAGDGQADGKTDAADAADVKIDTLSDGCVATCDCDGDGHKAKGAPCGGDDCDDDDPRAHPGADFVCDKPNPLTTKGDWDCNGVVDAQTPVNVVCTVTVGACPPNGFTDNPGCGNTSGNRVTCLVSGLGCKEGTKTTVTQCCK